MKGTEAEACEATMQACIPKVTRVVLVPCDGVQKALEIWDVDIKFSLQDDCRTLKIFTSKKPKKRSDVAKDLHTPKYRQRVKPDKKKNPKGPSLEDMLKEQE
jgi:hypothetical protein